MFNKTVKIVNLTPHALNLFRDGNHILEIPSTGNVRVATQSQQMGVFNSDGVDVPVYATTFGEVVGLPPQTDGIVYVVSLLVKQACPSRTDLFSPSQLVRDDGGRIIGMLGLE